MAQKKWIGVATASAFGVGVISAGAAASFAQSMPLADQPAVSGEVAPLALVPERTFEVSSDVIFNTEPAVVLAEPAPIAPSNVESTPGDIIPVNLPQAVTPTVTVPTVNSPVTPMTVPTPQSPASPVTQPSPVSPVTQPSPVSPVTQPSPVSPVTPASPASPASNPTPVSVA